jgi:hypothetical protein
MPKRKILASLATNQPAISAKPEGRAGFLPQPSQAFAKATGAKSRAHRGGGTSVHKP